MIRKDNYESLTLDEKMSMVTKMLYRLDYPESAQAIEEAKSLIKELQEDSQRYRWLRDNKHLDMWWSVDGPDNRHDNIDTDIDEAMNEHKLTQPKE